MQLMINIRSVRSVSTDSSVLLVSFGSLQRLLEYMDDGIEGLGWLFLLPLGIRSRDWTSMSPKYSSSFLSHRISFQT